MIVEVDETNYQEMIEEEFSKGKIVVLQFTSPYCDACMAMEFELEELDDEMQDISILAIDCANSEALAQDYDIIEVPTIKIYKDAQTLIFDGVGVVLAADIKEIIQESCRDL
jgi:thioredoxin 1